MRRILICTGILGGGTALTFVTAAMAASLLPGGTVISGSPVMVERDWMNGPAILLPAPEPVPPDVQVDGDIQWLPVDGTSSEKG